MPVWPADTEDTVVYNTREVIADKDLLLRLIDNSYLSIYGKIIINSIPYSPPERMDIRELGLKGDGSNEAAAFQAAINLNIPLLVPKGMKISIGSQIKLITNTDLQIDGRIERTWEGGGQGSNGALFTHYGVYPETKGIKIRGSGSVGAPSQLVGSGFIFAVASDDMWIQDITVDNYHIGAAFLIWGNRIRMFNVKVLNSEVDSGTGGIRMCGGDDFIAYGCHIESGDDCLQFTPGETSLAFSIRRGAYVGCTGFSTLGRFMVAISAGLANGVIEDCSFIGCHGKASQRGIYVTCIENSNAHVKRISFRDCSVDCSNDNQQTAMGAIAVYGDTAGTGSLSEVTFDNVSILNPSRVGVDITDAQQVTFNNCYFEPMRNTYNTYFRALGGLIEDLVVRNCTFKNCTADFAVMDITSTSGTSSRVTIENNVFTGIQAGVTYGITWGNGSDFVCRGNKFKNLGAALSACIRSGGNGFNGLIEENDFSEFAAPDPISVITAGQIHCRNNKGFSQIVGPTNGNYNLQGCDSRRIIMINSPSSARLINIPADTGATLPIGEWIEVINVGVQTVTITVAGPAVLTGASVLTTGQSARVTKTAVNAWYSTALPAPVAVPYLKPINSYPNISFTAALVDAGAYIRCTGTNPQYTLPANSVIAFPIKSEISGTCTSGPMTIVQGAGALVNKARTLVTVAAFSGWTAIKVNTDEWDIHGDFV